MKFFCEITGCIVVKTFGITKKLIKVGKVIGKDEIFTVEEKQVALIGKIQKGALELLHGKDS